MIVERTLYFAKAGKERDVLEMRRRASRVRVELGLRSGSIFVRRGESDAPDVAWECCFVSAEEQQVDLEARGSSEAFSEIRDAMGGLIDRFERHVFETTGFADVAPDALTMQPTVHRFESEGAELVAYAYTPPGDGPHPLIVLNHGSGVTQGSSDVSKPSVASVLLSFGVACLFPNRWGYGNSPGRSWREDVTAEFGTPDYDRQLVQRLHRESDDVVAAGHYGRTLAGIDPKRIGVMGSSFGGTVSLLAAAKDDAFRCCLDFAGAAMNWEKTPRLRALMKQAARAAECPIFLIQAENDHSTRPTSELAAVLHDAGRTHRAKIFPPFGANRDEGHWFERAGSILWRADVRQFLEQFL